MDQNRNTDPYRRSQYANHPQRAQRPADSQQVARSQQPQRAQRPADSPYAQQPQRAQRSAAAQQPQRAQRMPQSGSSRDYAYGSGRYHANKKSKAPYIVLAVLLVAAIAVLGFAVSGLFAGKGNTATNQSSTSGPMAVTDTSTGQTPAAAPAASSDSIVMTLGGSQDTYVLVGESYLEAGCHATDLEEGNITPSVTTQGNVDASKVGDYTVTYTATNSKGATATKTRTVHVVSSMDADTDGISVLMYHYIYHDTPEEENSNFLSDVDFEEQLAWLQSENFYYPSYQELQAYVNGTHTLPAKSVILTFDDGEQGFLDYGVPLLEKYQIPATSFIICIDDDAQWKTIHYASEYVSYQSHSYSLHAAGYSGQGHGGRIYDLSTEELVDDFKKASDILGTNEALAYPFGDVSDVAPEAVRQAGILCAFTTDYDQAHIGDDPAKLSRIRVFAGNSLDSYMYQVLNGS
ncbi:MAG: DUF5011 domain-containing protein [Coriobacteriia bacterium]|nr:DUF5011 domain-containing protein [Coriobacteriia bacterium]